MAGEKGRDARAEMTFHPHEVWQAMVPESGWMERKAKRA